ncbi:MAG: hypothetical protein Q8Q14_04680 [Gemmatimonadales bacterium]|nr:hypothetical protein [Gemmatimonadales bacterium]
MSEADLRAFLDAHGTPGCPPGRSGLYVIEVDRPGATSCLAVAVVLYEPDDSDFYLLGPCPSAPLPGHVIRHAPLPPLGGRFAVCEVCGGEGLLECPPGDNQPCPYCGSTSHPLATPGVRWEAGR